MRDGVLTMDEGVSISLDVLLGLGCDAISNMVRNSENITATYESLRFQIPDIHSPLWNKSKYGGCFEDLCQNLWGSGNADITGIGVFIAYALEVSFTAFLSTLLLICRQRTGEQEISHMHTKTKALVKSLNVFVDASIFFALAIAIATMVLIWLPDGLSQNDQIKALLSSIITVAPCLAALFTLQCCGEKVGRRMCVLGLACLINVAFIAIPGIVVLIPGIARPAKKTGDNYGFISNKELNTIANMNATIVYSNLTSGYGDKIGDYFLRACYGRQDVVQLSHYLVIIAMSGQILLLGLTALFGLNMAKLQFVELMWNIRWIWRVGSCHVPPRAEGAVQRTLQRRNKYLPNRLEIFGFMLVPLVLAVWTGYILLGLRLGTRTWIGKDETQWGFGQIVAVMMFLPVIIEFPYQWLSNRQSKGGMEEYRDRQRQQLQGEYDPSGLEEGKSSYAKKSGTRAYQEMNPQAGECGAMATAIEVHERRDNDGSASSYTHSRPDEIRYSGRVLTPPVPPPPPSSGSFAAPVPPAAHTSSHHQYSNQQYEGPTARP